MIVFFVSSGVHIGIGHVKRCSQLALDLIHQHHSIVLCLQNDPKSMDIVKKAGLDFSIMNEEETLTDELKKHSNIELIVLDLLHISGKETQQIKQAFPSTPLLALDYFDMHDSNVSTIINLVNPGKIKKPLDPAVKYLEGPAYGILRNEFQSIVNEGIIPKKKLEHILVTFGGSDPRRHTLTLVPLLDAIIQSMNIKVTVVIGPNFIHRDQVIALLNDRSKFRWIENPPSMAVLMNASDLCICGSGTTILELAALGTPALIAPQSIEELDFSKHFESSGFAQMIGTLDSLDEKKLKHIITTYHADAALLTRTSKMGPTIWDGKGKERIVEEMSLLLKKPR